MNKKTLSIIAAIIAGISIVSFAFLNQNNDSENMMIEETNTIKSQEITAAKPQTAFSPPTLVSQSTMDSQPAPNIMIDDNGKIYVIYQDTVSGKTNLYLKTSSDNGDSFSQPVRVNSIEGDVVLDGRVAPSIKLGKNNEIYVLWANSRPEPNLFMGVYRTLVFAKSIDGGQTFLPSVGIANDELPSGKFFQDMSVSGDGTIHIAWLDSPAINNGTGYLKSDKSRPSTVRYTQSSDEGTTFAPTIPLDENPCPCCNVQLEADKENNVYVSWRKVFGEGPTQIRDMVVATSNDNGDNFSKPVKINEDNFNFDGCVHVGAPMSVDSKGNLHVVWYTGKNDSPGLYYATSSDHGKTFSEPLAILTSDWIPPQRVYLSIDDQDTVWVTWEDSTGHSADEKMWRYGSTKAMIYHAQIKDGQITKSSSPININEGKSPAIDSHKNMAAIVWTENDNSVMCSTTKDTL